MSDYTDIQPELDDFENAVYGEEVRSSMVSAIKKIHDVAESAAGAPNATTATAGQAPIADGAGGWQWGDVATSGDSVPTEVRQAIATLFSKGVYTEAGLDDEVAIIQSWATEITAISVSPATLQINGMSQETIVATTQPAGGIVTWSSSDESIATVAGGVVTPTGINGTCTITASCGGKSATCAVTVSGFATLLSIDAVYTQSGTVYDTDTLDSLKADLVVIANYSGGTSETVPASNYTLSGTLTVGTSTITVSYAGLTDTFSVTVSHMEVGLLYSWDFTQSLVDSIAGKEVTLAGNATRDSSGLKITSASDYASADVGMTSGRRIEIDIASYTRDNGSTHGRLITHSRVSTSQFDCGVLWRNSNVLSLYEGSWADSSVTDINALTGKTLGYEFNGPAEGSSTVYLDGAQVATISHSTFANVADTVELGSQSGQSGFILTVTAMRVYELTQ